MQHRRSRASLFRNLTLMGYCRPIVISSQPPRRHQKARLSQSRVIRDGKDAPTISFNQRTVGQEANRLNTYSFDKGAGLVPNGSEHARQRNADVMFKLLRGLLKFSAQGTKGKAIRPASTGIALPEHASFTRARSTPAAPSLGVLRSPDYGQR